MTPETLASALRDNRNSCRLCDWPSKLRYIDQPGVYAWTVDVDGARDLSARLGHRITAGIVYAGQAGAFAGRPSDATLRSRLHDNHITGKIRNSTFRLTLAGALLDELHQHIKGDRNIGQLGEATVRNWMNDHLSLTVAPFLDRRALANIERRVLAILDPPLNLKHMRQTPLRVTLGRRRSELRHPAK